MQEFKVVILQSIVPNYRLPFFHALQDVYGDQFILYHSDRNFKESESVRSINSKYVGRSIALPLRAFWQTGLRGISVTKDDFLFVGGNPRNLSLIFYLLFLKIFIRPHVVWWSHYKSANSSKLNKFLRLFIGGYVSNTFLFYTKKEVEAYKKDARTPRAAVALGNGLDIKNIKQYRNDYVSHQRCKNILFLGRLTHKSHVDLLISSLKFLKTPDVLLHIVGDGEPDKVNALKMAATDFEVSERIIWHGAFWNEKDVSVIANNCSIMVYPGAVGLSLIHAFAYGLPAVVHDNIEAHMPEISAFTPSVNGLSFKQGNSIDLANKIDALLCDHRSRSHMSANAIHVVSQDYNTNVMASKIIEICSARVGKT
jgi:glycosyltransferase involved in cell wall biosynthesis